MKDMKRFLKVVLALAVLTASLAGCAGNPAGGSSAAAGSAASTGSSSAAGGVQTVRVGTMGTYEPYSYVKDGKLTGYDIEVLRLVEKIDPSLKFEFVAGPWDTLFPGLDADKFQLLAQEITSNPDREKKYILSEQTYSQCVSQIIVKQGRTDIQSLKDLKGKKIGLTVGDSFTRLVEDWNNQNGKILTITYYNQDITTILQDISSGRIDATVNDPNMAVSKAKSQGLQVEPVGERIASDPVHLIYKKDDAGKTLSEKIDKDLAKLRADGSLSKLSVELLGADYSK